MENKTVSSEDILQEMESLRKKNAQAISIRKSRGLGIVCLVITFLCVLLLLFPSSVDWEIYKPLWYVTVVAGSGSVVWLGSFPAAWILQWKMKRLAGRTVKKEAPAAKPEPKKKAPAAALPQSDVPKSDKTPFCLPVFLRRCRLNRQLKELREQSDYCFIDAGQSYVRIVNQEDGSEKLFSLAKSVVCEVEFGDKMCHIAVNTIKDKAGHVGVQARWFPMDADRDAVQRAEAVWLSPNTPVALCYSEVVRHPNGSEETKGYLAHTITWIGGGF